MKNTPKNKKQGFKVNIQVSLVTIMLLTVIITAALIHFPWQILNRNSIDKLVLDLNERIMKNINQKINGFFDSALKTEYIIKDNFEKKIIDIHDKEKREQFYLSLLKANPNFTWISFGAPSGSFFGVQRETANRLVIHDNVWINNKELATRRIDFYEKKDNKFVKTSSRLIPHYDYYAPKRSWYKKSIKSFNPIWTNVYIFNTSKKPGINTAITYEENGKFTGVISIALELEDISRYLSSLKVGKTGIVFIINSQKKMIAFKDLNELTFKKSSDSGFSLKPLSKTKNALLQIAQKTILDNSNDINYNNNSMVNLRGESITNKKKYYVTLSPTENVDWTIVTVIPESDYLGEINKKIRLVYFLIIAMLIPLTIFVIIFVRSTLAKPILKITKQFKNVQNFELKKVESFPSVIKEINFLTTGLQQMTTSLTTFQKYLPVELVREIISRGIEAKAGGEEKEMTIFFSDLVSFTKLFEAKGNSLIPQLGEYFSRVSQVIVENLGVIDKYIGDSVMAFWGAPTPNPNHAIDACRAAIEYQVVLRNLCMKWQRDFRPQFKARIGINTGAVVVGNMGSDNRLNYTVLGDPVNVASRLESLNKYYGTEILIGMDTYNKAKDAIITRKVDSVAVYGREQAQDIYELIEMRDKVSVTDNFDWIKYYEEAHRYYITRQFKKAYELFKKANDLRNGKDTPSIIFIKNCIKFIKNPPNGDWNGSTIMNKK